jgi:hypothetical protein
VVPPVPVAPLIPGSPARPAVVPIPAKPGLIPGGQGRSMQVQVSNDSFSIQSKEDGVQYSIRGIAKDGKPEANRIEINEAGVVAEFPSLEKVPEKHKERVKQLLENVKFGK